MNVSVSCLKAFHDSSPSLAAIQQAAYSNSEREKRGLFSNTAPITRKLSAFLFRTEAILRRDNIKKDRGFHSWFVSQNKKEYKNHGRAAVPYSKNAKKEVLPLTLDSLRQHLNHASYQTFIWRSSLAALQDLQSPNTMDSYLRPGSCSA